MRIDPVQVAATVNQADLVSVRRDPLPQRTQLQNAQPQQPKPAPAEVAAETQISVTIDSDKNVIYQFLDARTGTIVQQVPPEQVLQVMRSIADLLRQSEQKVDLSV